MNFQVSSCSRTFDFDTSSIAFDAIDPINSSYGQLIDRHIPFCHIVANMVALRAVPETFGRMFRELTQPIAQRVLTYR